jgi:hypothetical protein
MSGVFFICVYSDYSESFHLRLTRRISFAPSRRCEVQCGYIRLAEFYHVLSLMSIATQARQNAKKSNLWTIGFALIMTESCEMCTEIAGQFFAGHN